MCRYETALFYVVPLCTTFLSGKTGRQFDVLWPRRIHRETVHPNYRSLVHRVFYSTARLHMFVTSPRFCGTVLRPLTRWLRRLWDGRRRQWAFLCAKICSSLCTFGDPAMEQIYQQSCNRLSTLLAQGNITRFVRTYLRSPCHQGLRRRRDGNSTHSRNVLDCRDKYFLLHTAWIFVSVVSLAVQNTTNTS